MFALCIVVRVEEISRREIKSEKRAEESLIKAA